MKKQELKQIIREVSQNKNPNKNNPDIWVEMLRYNATLMVSQGKNQEERIALLMEKYTLIKK
jgi:hypothetical protein